MNWIAGIDLGGTQIKALAWDLDADAKLETRIEPTRDGEPDMPWAHSIARILCETQATYGPPQAIGLSAPGLPNREQSAIAFMPGRMQGLEGFDWSDFLGAPVRVINDVQAALVAECWQGAARDCENVLMITLGTGVGGAILCDGNLLRGCIGRAGHVGHLCLDPHGVPGITRIPGALEDAIGEGTIGRRTTGRFLSTFELVKAAQGGDEHAQAAWDNSLRALACGIASLINIVDPEIVLVGGGIAEAGAALFDPLAAYLDEVEWRPGGHRVILKRPTFAEWAGAHGAACHAHQKKTDT